MAKRIEWARHRFALSMLLFAFGSFLHVRSLVNGFALDDYSNIVENPALRTFSLFVGALFDSSFPGNLYRPTQTLVNWIVYTIFGLSPAPFHCINLVLHGSAAVLAFRVLTHVASTRISFITVLLWIALPAHSEVVANASGMTELLVFVFGLGAIHCTLSGFSPILTGVLFAVALGSKENAATIPLLLALLLSQRWELSWDKFKPYAVASLGYAILRIIAVGINPWGTHIDPMDNQLVELTFQGRLFDAVALLGKYAFTVVLPLELSADYSFDHLHIWLEPGSTVPLACILVCIGILLLTRSRIHEVRIGACWFFLAFVVTANVLFPIGTVFAERLLYLPSLGITLALVGWLSRVGLIGFGLALVVVYSFMSSLQDSVWRSNRTLYMYQMGISPRSAKTQHNYGVLLRNAGELDEASIHVRQALRLYPCYADAASTLGSIYSMRGTFSGAEHWFRKALQCNPVHIPTLNRLGRIYFNRGEIEGAKVKFSQVLAINPYDIEATAGLLAVAIKKGDTSEATRILGFLDAIVPDSKEVHELRRKFETENK